MFIQQKVDAVKNTVLIKYSTLRCLRGLLPSEEGLKGKR